MTDGVSGLRQALAELIAMRDAQLLGLRRLADAGADVDGLQRFVGAIDGKIAKLERLFATLPGPTDRPALRVIDGGRDGLASVGHRSI